MRALVLIALLVPSIVWATPTESALTEAVQAAADACVSEAYPIAISKQPRDGKLAVKIIAGPGPTVALEVLPVVQPVGVGEAWTSAVLSACLRRQVALVMPGLRNKAEATVRVTFARPVADDGTRNDRLAETIGKRWLAAATKSCRATVNRPLVLEISKTGAVVVLTPNTPACLVRSASTLRMAAGSTTSTIRVPATTDGEEPGGTLRARLRDQLIPPQDRCYSGGCSGQGCSDQPNVTTICDMKPAYACLRHSRCERQRDGTCGWTATPSYDTCVKNPPPSREPGE